MPPCELACRARARCAGRRSVRLCSWDERDLTRARARPIPPVLVKSRRLLISPPSPPPSHDIWVPHPKHISCRPQRPGGQLSSCGPAAISCPGCSLGSWLPVPQEGAMGGGGAPGRAIWGRSGEMLECVLSHSLCFAFFCSLSGSAVNPGTTHSPQFWGPSPALEKPYKLGRSPGESHLALRQPSQGQPLVGTLRCQKCAELARTELLLVLPHTPVSSHVTQPLMSP